MNRALVLVLLAACGDNNELGGTLRFSPLSDLEIQDLLLTANGLVADSPVSFLEQAVACPSMDSDDTTTTFTGGCTASGLRIEGTAYRRDDVFTFDRFQIGERVYDGTVERRPVRSLVADLRVEDSGTTKHIELVRDCDGDGFCNVDGVLDIVGQGTARITGVAIHAYGTGKMSLDGAETLIAFSDRVPFPCVHWFIAGTERTGVGICVR